MKVYEEIEENKGRDIKISYDGMWPNTCSGTLQIEVDGKLVYCKRGYCRSTGSVWFDDNWSEHVEQGRLVWDEDEASNFDPEIQLLVSDHLSQYHVCCGGCV